MARKKRLITLHRGLSLAVAILLTLAIVVTVYLKSGLVSYQLSRYVNDHYLEGTPFRFSCARISGDLVRQVNVAQPVLRYHGRDRSFEVFRAERISLDYSLMQVIKFRLDAEDLRIVAPRVTIVEEPDGEILIPKLGGGSPSDGDPFAPIVSIKNFVINDARVAFERPDTSHVVSNVNLEGSLSWIDGKVSIDLENGNAVLPGPGLPIRSLRTKASIDESGLNVQDLAVRLERSFIIASGGYANGRFVRLQGAFNPLDLDELALLGVLNESGQVGGNVVAAGPLDSLAVSGSLTGRAFGLVFSKLALAGVVDPARVHLTTVEGTVYGAQLNGELTFQRSDGSYTFRGVCEGLDITEGFIDEEGVPATDLNGFIEIEHLASQDAYDVQADLRRSTIWNYHAHDVKARLGWRPTSGLRVRSATLTRPGSVLSAEGTLDSDGVVDMIVALSGDSLDYVLDFLSLPTIGGRADLSGRLAGHTDDMQLNLNGRWQDLTYEFTAIDSAAVQAEVRGIGGEQVFARLDLSGRALSLWGHGFTKPHVLMEARENFLHFRDLTFSRGDTLVTSSFTLVPGEPADVTVRHVVVATPRSTWALQDSTKLVVDNDLLRVGTFVLRSEESQVGGSGQVDQSAETCDVHIWGHGLDLSLLQEAARAPFTISGLGQFRTRIFGSLNDPSVELSTFLSDGLIDSLGFDRLSFQGAYSPPERYRVDQLRVVSGSDSMSVAGTWGFPGSPIGLLLEGAPHDELLHAPIHLEITSHHYSLDALLRVAHRKPLWNAAFEGEMVIGNTPADPTITLQGGLVSRPTDRYRLPRIETNLQYADGTLSIRSLSFDDGSARASLTGTVPMRIGLGHGVPINLDTPVDLQAQVGASDLSAAAVYFGWVAAAAGGLGGKIDVTGTIGRPIFNGRLDVEDLGVRIAGMEEIYHGVNARIDAVDNVVRLTSLHGHEGQKGRFSGEGTAQLRGFRLESYEVALDLQEFTLASIADFISTFDGHVTVTSRPLEDGARIPDIGGSLHVRQAVITKALGRSEGPPSPLTLPTESPSWLCDLKIEAPNNVWVRNADLRMEVAGNVILKRDVQGLYLRGDMNVLRGSYNVYNNKFSITDGRFNFSTTNLRPEIQLSAYTPHRRTDQSESRIFLDFSWAADKPEPTITLSYSEPGYSEADIWKMLGGQVVAGSGEITAAGAAQNIAGNYLERILNAQMSGTTIDVESREIGSSDGFQTSREREMSVAVGRYLSEDLYLKYRQGLNLSTDRQFDIEYRISNMLLLRSEIISHARKGLQGKSAQTTDEINFDVKFRWEF